MIEFVVVNASTGEIEPNCPHCGIRSVSFKKDFGLHPVAPGHMKYKLNSKNKEGEKIHHLDEEGKSYKYKIKIDSKGKPAGLEIKNG